MNGASGRKAATMAQSRSKGVNGDWPVVVRVSAAGAEDQHGDVERRGEEGEKDRAFAGAEDEGADGGADQGEKECGGEDGQG